MTKLPNQKRPCKDCPFRKDCLPGWLGKKRMEGILQAGSFVCHKDTSLQCAGHMLMKGDSNDFVRLADRLGMDTGIKGKDLIFPDEAACISHHS